MESYEREHIEVLRKLAPECMVLLKSDGSFPLDTPCRIALYGCGGRRTVKGGTGSGDVNVRHYTTVEEGLENAGFTVTTKSWLDAYDDAWNAADKAYKAAIKERVQTQGLNAAMGSNREGRVEPEYDFPLDGEGDTAVYVLSRTSGEAEDRSARKGDVMLSDTEVRDILAVVDKYPRFLLALNVSSVVDLSPVLERVKNILLISQTGMTVGDSFADVLLGKAYPSGKLASTWAKWEDYPAMGDFGGQDDTCYREGIYVGYRYFDSVAAEPIFPFGFGLGYTGFVLENSELSLTGSIVTVKTYVRNIGLRPGKEVVQIYISVPEGKLNQPAKTLAAFQKTGELDEGMIQEMTIAFDLRDIASFDSSLAASVLEKGEYVVHVGNSSRNTMAVAVVSLDETVIVRQLHHVGGIPDFEDWKPEQKIGCTYDTLPVFVMKAADVEKIPLGSRHEPSEEARTLAASMTDEELGYLCVGGFREGGQRHFIGNSDMIVAGAAGQTTERLKHYGIFPVVMGDGPAGLRLSREYGVNKDGVFSIDNSTMNFLVDILPDFALAALGIAPDRERPEGEIREQNCSAIPVGAALAQSWNTEVCEACGDLVGDEMEKFGIDLWLAPAMNIHRSILCGRNFEYYSEDPLISGKMAAAITRGVQKHAGKGVTIKHFVCNNQETNRFYSNSQVSERALRDIYFKGFEIAVREAHPMAVMSSYNLLNGIHTAQRGDLLETMLRDEWGHEGIVMSDWVTPNAIHVGQHKYPAVHTAGAVGAGNDIMMPGTDADHNLLMEALSSKDAPYPITRVQLEKCAARVIELTFAVKRGRETEASQTL